VLRLGRTKSKEEEFTQKVLRTELCLIGSPWRKIWMGREFAGRIGAPVLVSEVGKKRKAGSAEYGKSKRRVCRLERAAESNNLVKKGDPYLNVLYQVSF